MSVTKRLIRLLSCAALFAAIMTPGHAATGSAPTRQARMNGEHPGVFIRDGDGQGKAILKFRPGKGRICYDLRYRKIVVFHIDVRRVADQELVQELYHEAPTRRSLSGCRGGIEPQLVRKIKKHPRRFYVRASEYHGGDIAGTLRRPSV